MQNMQNMLNKQYMIAKKLPESSRGMSAPYKRYVSPVQRHTNQPACLAQGQAPPKQFVGIIIGITIACVVLGINFVGDH